MGESYTVKQGDCLSSIAKQFGFRTWQSLWDYPGNAKLREVRKNPNILYPGDVVEIPDRDAKELPMQSGMLHTFKLHRSFTRLRLVLTGLDDVPIANVAYTVVAGGQQLRGTTSEAGLIDVAVPEDAATATLTMDATGDTKTLLLGALDPIDKPSGYQARLKNLGYDCGKVDGIDGPKTKHAVRLFQTDNPPLKVDGVCGPLTQDVLRTRYGC